MLELTFNFMGRLRILFSGKIKLSDDACSTIRHDLNKNMQYDNKCIPQFTKTGEIIYMTKEEIECINNGVNYE